jgi:hypothetical protein
MNKTIAIVLVVLAIASFAIVAVATTASPVQAYIIPNVCGGAGEPICAEYCAANPSHPDCR